MLNTVAICGRLVRDPELRRTSSDVSVCSFAVACERDAGAKGEKQSDFINVTAWRQTADFINRYFKKGSMIIVTGRLQSRKFVDNDGNNRTNWEIVADRVYFGESKKQNTDQTDTEEYGVVDDDLPI